MQISEELEEQEWEASMPIEEEADEYHEHPEYKHRTIDKVAYEEEETGSSESGDEEDGSGAKEFIQIFDEDLEEESAQQLKNIREEAEKSPSTEEGQPPEEQPLEDLSKAKTHVVKSPEAEAAKEKEEEEAAKEEDPTRILSTRLPVKHLVFYGDSDEEEEASKEKEEPRKEKGAEVLLITEKGEDSQDAPKDKSAMPDWLEK